MKRIYIIPIFLLALTLGTFAQKTVGLDNWFNREVNTKTGKIYHYTWDDTQNSGFSQFGQVFINHSAKLLTISANPNSKSLKNVDIYIIVDPDTTSENPAPNYVNANDIIFLKKWVSTGGVLLLMANDGPNCEFTHFNHLSEAFGFHFLAQTLNPVVNSKWEMGAEIKLPDHPIFSGVKKIFIKEVAPILLSKGAKAVLKDGDTNAVIIAETKYGKGYVMAIGDPWLYNEYIDHERLPESFENLKAANNLVDFLLKK